uniref:Type II toxin-antitoxin system prevent-host-death family antitoxin n=1 Tax=Desulfatirhabdium butyrativorans TaxID=340467 RepID=A0A7C4RUH4_9BACT
MGSLSWDRCPKKSVWFLGRGEKIMITKHGVPVATLQPADSAKRTPVCDVIAQLKRFRSGHRLDGLSIREMIEKGRH